MKKKDEKPSNAKPVSSFGGRSNGVRGYGYLLERAEKRDHLTKHLGIRVGIHINLTAGRRCAVAFQHDHAGMKSARLGPDDQDVARIDLESGRKGIEESVPDGKKVFGADIVRQQTGIDMIIGGRRTGIVGILQVKRDTDRTFLRQRRPHSDADWADAAATALLPDDNALAFQCGNMRRRGGRFDGKILGNVIKGWGDSIFTDEIANKTRNLKLPFCNFLHSSGPGVGISVTPGQRRKPGVVILKWGNLAFDKIQYNVKMQVSSDICNFFESIFKVYLQMYAIFRYRRQPERLDFSGPAWYLI